TRTLLTEIDVPNPDGALSPGLYLTVELHIPRKTPSVIVPADALVFNSRGLQVVVIENGIARFRKVTVARDLGTEVELRDGIKAGDEVILRPMVNLADGSKVHAAPIEKSEKIQTSIAGDRPPSATGQGWNVKPKVRAGGMNGTPSSYCSCGGLVGLRHGRGPDDVAKPESYAARPPA